MEPCNFLFQGILTIVKKKGKFFEISYIFFNENYANLFPMQSKNRSKLYR